MSSRVRVIPKLEIKGPNLIKGLQYEGNRVLGTAWDFAERYYLEGADELIFQDAVASLYRRNGLLDFIRRTAENIFVPLTVGGGIRSVDDIREILRAGADKVAINTAAVERPGLITEAASVFGSQCIVSSIEAFCVDGRYYVWTDFGRQTTTLDAIEWAQQVVDLGAGEILLTSISNDGLGQGYDLRLIESVARRVSVPVIASGGAGSADDLPRAVASGADAVCAASIFHYHYMKPVQAPTMMFHERRLRMGEQIDSGNVEFLASGYGNDRAILVSPCSISSAKAALRGAQVAVREVEVTP